MLTTRPGIGQRPAGVQRSSGSQVLVALSMAWLLATCGARPVGGAPDAGPVGTTPLPGWEGRLTQFNIDSPVAGIAGRAVTVLLPPGYSDPAQASTRYPAFYLHDGNNCLDRDPFGHGGWQVHLTATDLMTRAVMAPAIVVMVANSPARTEEYNPGAGTAPGPTADGYLDYLEHAVIPFVEQRYRVQPGAANRGIGGSSFGGIISLYAGFTRPSVYGVVMAMSTAPSVYDVKARIEATAGKAPLRIYLDSGTIDPFGPNGTNLVNDFQDYTVAMRDLLVSRGWVLGQDLDYALGVGDTHDESAWRRRLPGALSFLFPPGR
ncbi:MAG TPA: alpha/beta hydrolase-fold protein [Myxococcaceae bacterium]|nr:alpha/beta hydrolase-fold protein [Myxococcaceae bacterium]